MAETKCIHTKIKDYVIDNWKVLLISFLSGFGLAFILSHLTIV